MLRSRHAMFACAAAVLGLLCLAPAASATPPIPAPLNGTVSYPAGEVCPFPVRIDPGVNRDLLHILRNVQWIVTGHFIQTATNLATSFTTTVRSPSSTTARSCGRTSRRMWTARGWSYTQGTS